jgi:lysophospholipase L1-like esterase
VINTAVVLFSLAVSLIAVDLGLRLFTSIGPRSGTLMPAPDASQRLTARTSSMSPGYVGQLQGRDFSSIPVRTNALGFRDEERDIESLSNSETVLFLGDSYIFGWGIEREDRLSEILEAKLGTSGVRVQVLNMALPGWGTYQHLDVLHAYGWRLRPKLVILGFFVGNDFLDDIATRSADRGTFTEINAGPLLLPVSNIERRVRRLLRSSPVFNLLTYGLWNVGAFRQLFNRLEVRNDRIDLYGPLTEQRKQELYAPTMEALAAVSKFCREFGTAVLVALIPDHLQVLSPEIFASYDLAQPQRILSEHLNDIGLPYVDLLPTLRNAPDPQRLYFREDKHWTREGHAWVAPVLVARALESLRHAELTVSLKGGRGLSTCFE